MTSRTEIYNQVMTAITSEEPDIVSPDQTGYVTRVLNRHWVSSLRELQRMHPWNFCKWRARLSLSSYKPPFGWTYAYEKPGNWLRVLHITEDGSENGKPVKYEIEGGFILTNKSAPLPVRYIQLVEDVTKFDPLFTQALVYHLAAKLAGGMAGRASLVENLLNIRRDAIQTAREIDSIEENYEAVAPSDIFDARTDPFTGRFD